MRFTIAMAWIIVMRSGRTRSAGRYITLPDMGMGACGRNTATQSFSSGSSRYPICQPPLDADQCRLHAVRAFDLSKALGHALHHLVLRETAEKGVLEPERDALARIRAGDDAGDDRNEDQHQHREDSDCHDAGHVVQLQAFRNRLCHLSRQPHRVTQNDHNENHRHEEQQPPAIVAFKNFIKEVPIPCFGIPI
jgi:hypothetical protein